VWSGAWGREPASVTIANKRVVSDQYQGVSHPVTKSKVAATKIVNRDHGVTVVLTRTGATTASASLHSDHGDATAELTRQQRQRTKSR
jgi:hypothetical protein